MTGVRSQASCAFNMLLLASRILYCRTVYWQNGPRRMRLRSFTRCVMCPATRLKKVTLAFYPCPSCSPWSPSVSPQFLQFTRFRRYPVPSELAYKCDAEDSPRTEFDTEARQWLELISVDLPTKGQHVHCQISVAVLRNTISVIAINVSHKKTYGWLTDKSSDAPLHVPRFSCQNLKTMFRQLFLYTLLLQLH